MKINEKSMNILQETLEILFNEGITDAKEAIKKPEIKSLLDEIFKKYNKTDNISYSDLANYFSNDEIFDLVLLYLTDYKKIEISDSIEEEQEVVDELELLDYATESKNNDPVGLFLKELNQSCYDKMTPEEEKEKFMVYLKSKEENDGVGNPIIRQEIIQRNIKLVVSIAKHYAKKMSLSDLINVGIKGLDIAVDRYDPERGYKFSTYSTWWIKQAITRFISNEQRLIRLPVHLHEEINKIYREQAKYESINGVSPTIEELSKLTNLPKERIIRNLEVATKPQSLQDPVANDDSSTDEVQDFIADPKESVEDIIEQKDCLKMIIKALCACVDGERGSCQYKTSLKGIRVVIERKGINLCDERLENDENAKWLLHEIVTYLHVSPNLITSDEQKTLEKVGKEMGVTRERIRQVEAKTLRKLKNPIRYKYIKDYMMYPDKNRMC